MLFGQLGVMPALVYIRPRENSHVDGAEGSIPDGAISL